MKKEVGVKSLIIRYFIIILLGLPPLWFFSKVFTPLTIYPVLFILGLFFDVILSGATILVSSTFAIEIIEACVAGSAYYLLLILNLSTPKINLSKRIKMLLLGFLIFLVLNILRILFLSSLYISGSGWFDFTHELFWYLVSIGFVVLIWFFQVKLFKIKKIPFYSDLKTLYIASNLRKRKKSKGR